MKKLKTLGRTMQKTTLGAMLLGIVVCSSVWGATPGIYQYDGDGVAQYVNFVVGFDGVIKSSTVYNGGLGYWESHTFTGGELNSAYRSWSGYQWVTYQGGHDHMFSYSVTEVYPSGVIEGTYSWSYDFTKATIYIHRPGDNVNPASTSDVPFRVVCEPAYARFERTNNLDFPAEGGTEAVYVEYGIATVDVEYEESESISVVPTEDWLHVSQISSSSGRVGYRVSADPTDSLSARIAFLKLTGGMLGEQSLAVAQSAGVPCAVILHPGDHGSIAEANSGGSYVETVMRGAAFPKVTVDTDMGWGFMGWNPAEPAVVMNDFEATARYVLINGVENVFAAQVPGTKMVRITYDVAFEGAGIVPVSLAVSNGTEAVSCLSVSGDIGERVAIGPGKTILWDMGADWNGNVSSSMVFAVTAGVGEMVEIPAGTNSGTNPLGAGESYDDIYPETYSLTVDSFFMDKHEVTNDEMARVLQWAYDQGKITVSSSAVTNALGVPKRLVRLDYNPQLTWDGSAFCIKSAKGRGYPCMNVTWYGTAAYCNYRSEMEGLTPCYDLSDWSCDVSADGYRLPTVEEWEYAARGGLSSKRFPWGDTITHNVANYESSDSYEYDISATRGDHPDYDNDYPYYASPVGSFAANGYGLYDMAGNVYEWCSEPDGSVYAIKGGGFNSDADSVRCGDLVLNSAALNQFGPRLSGIELGFRTIRRSAGQPPVEQKVVPDCFVDSRDYTLTVSSAQGGNPDPAVGQHSNYCWGSSVTCSVDSAASIYSFAGWTGTGSIPPEGGTTNLNVTLTNPHSSLVWNWEWLGATYTVTLHPGDHGSIADANSGMDYVEMVIDGGAFPAVEVDADTGWDFMGWNPVAPSVLTTDFEATAQYAVSHYTFTFNAGNHGTVGGGGRVEQDYVHGDTVMPPEPAPKQGYRFTGWSVAVPSTAIADFETTARYKEINGIDNLWAAQVPGTKTVEITYDVWCTETDVVRVSLVLKNGTEAVACPSISGDIGADMSTGSGKRIVWDMGEDWDGNLAELSVALAAAYGSAPIGGDPNAVSWEEVGGWIKNTYSNGDVTMSDRHSDRMWLCNANPDGWAMTWSEAVAYCNGLNYAGYSGWMLPDDTALEEQHGQKAFFDNVQSAYWSNISFMDIAVYVDLSNFLPLPPGYDSVYAYYYVWPVRTLQSGSVQLGLSSGSVAFTADSRDYTLTVSSAQGGNPDPAVGMHSNYFWGSSVTCSVDVVVGEYTCTGWTGTGSVPPEGGTTSLNVTLSNQHSSITWNWGMPVPDVLEWSVSEGQVTITDCDASASGSLVIPSIIEGYPVTIIGKDAFNSCASLTNIVIPDSVITIGDYAFFWCSSLTNVVIPDSVSAISKYAFCGCDGLKNVMLGVGVTNIGAYAFYNCDALTSVIMPDSLISIDNAAFGYCDSLTNITIGAGVTNIGSATFYRCDNLIGISVDASNPAFCSVDGVLFSNNKDCLVCYPAGKSDTSYMIPDSITTVGGYAFGACKGLTNIILGTNITSIDNRAFLGCSSLTSVIIPNSVTTLGYYTFWNCSSLTNVSIGTAVTNIDGGSFCHCDALTSVTIPASVSRIDGGAFSSCDRLKKAIFAGDAPDSFGSGVFDDAAFGFTVYYYEGAEGFTTPEWEGYPSEMLSAPPSDPYDVWKDTVFTGSGYSAAQMEREADPDGDGQSNFMEYVFGTSPTNGLDARVLECRIQDGGMKLDVKSCEKRWYMIEGTADLTSSNWLVLGRFFGTGTNVLLFDPDVFGQQYYRIKAEVMEDDPALNDADGDGVNDMSDSAPFSKDSDGDGMPDAWEALYSLNASVSNTVADSDSDGYSDYAEYVFGTRPDDAGSRFGWGTSNWLDGGVLHSKLSVGTVSGRVYSVEYTPSLTNEWNVLTRFGGSDGTNTVDLVPDSQDKGFFRIKATDGNVLIMQE